MYICIYIYTVCVWKWILRLWHNNGKNIKVDQGDFSGIGPLSI